MSRHKFVKAAIFLTLRPNQIVVQVGLFGQRRTVVRHNGANLTNQAPNIPCFIRFLPSRSEMNALKQVCRRDKAAPIVPQSRKPLLQKRPMCYSRKAREKSRLLSPSPQELFTAAMTMLGSWPSIQMQSRVIVHHSTRDESNRILVFGR